jgi:hypothetical protein
LMRWAFLFLQLTPTKYLNTEESRTPWNKFTTVQSLYIRGKLSYKTEFKIADRFFFFFCKPFTCCFYPIVVWVLAVCHQGLFMKCTVKGNKNKGHIMQVIA